MERDSRMSKHTGRASRSSRMSKTGRKRGDRSRAGGASHLSASSSRRGGGGQAESTAIKVMVDGVNVTPHSLVSKSVREERAAAAGGGGGGGGGRSQAQGSGTSPTPSDTSDIERSSQAGYTSGFNSQDEDGDSRSDSELGESENEQHHPAKKGGGGGGGDAADAGDDAAAAAAAAAANDGALTEEELAAPSDISLNETATITLLFIPGKCIAQDSALHPVVSARNEEYQRLCDSRQGGSDLFANHFCQTNNFAQKNKEVMASPPATRDAGCIASIWDIYDSQRTDDGPANEDIDSVAVGDSKADAGDQQTELSKQVDRMVMASLASPGCLLDVNDLATEAPAEAKQRRKRGARGGATGNSGNSPHMSGATTRGGESGATSGAVGRSSVSGAVSSALSHSSSKDHHSSSKDNESSASGDGKHSDGGSGADSGAGAKGVGNHGGRGKIVTSEVAEVLARKQAEEIMVSGELLRCCAAIERALQQNIFHERHLLYRDYPGAELKDDDDDEAEAERERARATQPPELAEMAALLGTEEQLETRRVRKLQPLWTFECELTRGRTVSCMTWNRANHDLLAVSYGNFDFTTQQSGLVLFWSLKNPEYPERVLELRVGATALDFSTTHPNLLAVGCYDGTVAIYDLGKEANTPVLDSASSAGKHMDAVWQVKWVDRGNERGESLVSISTDGRVTMWGMSKGLDYSDLMVLKRVPNQVVGADAGGEGVISRTAAGLSFDFPLGDSATYLAGTEDGIIHKCSCSYNEQYLDSYFGHSGPVYKLRASPYLPNAFLSCSADWTVKLWDQSRQEAAHTFHSVDLADVVHDIAWSPAHATVFGSVTGDGRIEIWDLAESTLDPYITYYPPVPAPVVEEEAAPEAAGDDDDDTPPASRSGTPATKLRAAAAAAAAKEEETPTVIPVTSITFSLNAPVLVTGNKMGSVAVYRMHGVGPEETLTDEQQRVKLAEAMRPQNEARIS